MSSTNKTTNLKLNSWIGSDLPQREDFNRDNSIIDSAVTAHTSDAALHTSTAEKSKWNTPYYLGTYFGNGSSSRNLDLSCDFQPSWGLLFAANAMPGVSDFSNKAHYNYFALVSKSGSVNGVTLNGKRLTLVQSATAVNGNEYRSFNETGTTYVYIMFR